MHELDSSKPELVFGMNMRKTCCVWKNKCSSQSVSLFWVVNIVMRAMLHRYDMKNKHRQSSLASVFNFIISVLLSPIV